MIAALEKVDPVVAHQTDIDGRKQYFLEIFKVIVRAFAFPCSVHDLGHGGGRDLGFGGSTRQSTAAEEASASVEIIRGMIQKNVENAIQTESIANESAKDARESGAKGLAAASR